MNRDQLRDAVSAGIITEDQARRIEARATGVSGDGELENESLKFLSNLNDIFLTIGIVILFFGLSAAASILSFGAVSFKHLAPAIAFPLAGIAWLLAEYFTARRKMLLPSIALAIAFSLFIGLGAFSLTAWMQIEDSTGSLLGGLQSGSASVSGAISDYAGDTKASLLTGCGVAFLAALGFYLRFRLPFSMFLMAACLTLAVYILAYSYVTLLIAGCITLLVAILFDARDPERRTRIADNGFWLHVAAAPLLVYSFRGVLNLDAGVESSAVLVGLFVVLAILSLLLNRRALILSALFSFGIAVWTLFHAFGDGLLMTFAAPLLFIGGLIVLLGAGWRTARGILLQPIPSTGPWSRIFPPEPRLND